MKRETLKTRYLFGICLALAPSAFLVPFTLADTSPALPAHEDLREDWYRVEIGGVSAGWMSTRTVPGGGQLRTESKLRLRLKRGAVEASMEMSTRVVETTDGRLLEAWSKQVLGPLPVETHYEFLADEIVVTTRQGGQESEERRPYPEGDWLTPVQVQTETLERLAAGAETFTYRTLDPQFGIEPVEINWTLEEEGVEVAALGRSFVTRRYRQTASFAPQLASQVYLAADGRLVRSSMPMMGLTMNLLLASRDEVLAERGAPELLVSTFIRPDRAIRAPRSVRRAVYELRLAEGEFPELPSAGNQAVQRLSTEGPEGGDMVRITVDLDRPAAPAGEVEDGVYLRSTFLIDHESDAVRRLYGEKSGDLERLEGDSLRRAEVWRAFVSRHLSDKNLELLLASAGEVARRQAGDCTEHSVLLAALLRADGIPARLAAGLVYVDRFAGSDRVFGYHMWTQARIGDRWVDLDASFQTPFDATHIALATTALRDHETALRELAGVTSLIGNVEIRVLETSSHGEEEGHG